MFIVFSGRTRPHILCQFHRTVPLHQYTRLVMIPNHLLFIRCFSCAVLWCYLFCSLFFSSAFIDEPNTNIRRLSHSNRIPWKCLWATYSWVGARTAPPRWTVCVVLTCVCLRFVYSILMFCTNVSVNRNRIARTSNVAACGDTHYTTHTHTLARTLYTTPLLDRRHILYSTCTSHHISTLGMSFYVHVHVVT